MSILSKIVRKTRDNLEIVICGFLFLLLLFRNPFSLRTQIANFAPAPDAFYYVVPARSLVQGLGPYMVREGLSYSPIVPPLYTFVLAPFYLINEDPRMFYFANVILAFLAFVIFLNILRVLFPNRRLIHFLLLFLFVSNHAIYWFPTLAMAENLMLPIFLGCLWLLFIKPTIGRSVLMGFLAVCLYATKFVSLPLMAVFVLLYVLKLQHRFGYQKEFWRMSMICILTAQVAFLLFGIYTGVMLNQSDYFDPVNRVLNALRFRPVLSETKSVEAVVSPQEAETLWFSFKHAPNNFPFYLRAVTGRGMQILWEWTPLLSIPVALIGWLGLVLAFLGKKHFEAFSIFVLIVSQIFLLLLFYTPDGRYVMHVIPALILGVGFFFSWLEDRNVKVAKVILIAFMGLTLFTSASRLKKDIMLNLRYTESPWWYIAVLELNKTIDAEIILGEVNDKRPFVITPLYPYLVDFFSTGKYALLPMSPKQEFRAYKEYVWGDFDYNQLETEYLRLIDEGHPLYLASYGIGHEEALIDSFDYLQKAFVLKEISSECHNLCKIYRVLPSGKPLNLKELK